MPVLERSNVGNVSIAPNTQTKEWSPGRLEEVVRVHQGVDDEVHDDEPPGGGGVLAEGVPAVDQDGHVVVPGSRLAMIIRNFVQTDY